MTEDPESSVAVSQSLFLLLLRIAHKEEAVPVMQSISLHFHSSSYWKESVPPTSPHTHMHTDKCMCINTHTHTHVCSSLSASLEGLHFLDTPWVHPAYRTQGNLRPTSPNTFESTQGKFMLKEFGVWETPFLILKKNARSSRQLVPSCTKIHMVLTSEIE